MHGFNVRLGTAEERTDELEDGSEGNSHAEMQKNKGWKVKEGKKYKGNVEMI